MTDKYADIRAALGAATPGPWERHDTGGFFKCVRQSGSGRGICSTFVQNTPKTPAGCETQRHQNNANSDYIAAANPETIRALLAERDALLEALQSIVDCCDEDHAARDYSSRQTEIRGIARYALAQEQGGSDAQD